MSGFYDVMQVCRRGHIITNVAANEPQHISEHCPVCGAPTLVKCERCQAPLRGLYCHEGYLSVATDRQSYCYECGEPHPWTEERLQAAREFAGEVDGLSEKDRTQLAKSFEDIASDNPRTTLGVLRIKKYMAKVGKPVSDLLYKFAVDVASATAVKLMKGD
jgi:hypothetical protein